MRLDWHGERLELRPERAVWWHRRATLLVADTHFGKPATFRRAGVPVPEGVTGGDLERLGRLVDATGAERLIVLGDFFHARSGRHRATLDALRAWRRSRDTLAIDVVRGNHDRSAGDPPASWRMVCVEGPLVLDPFDLVHDPAEAGDRPALAGHVHPVALLAGRAGPRLRLPCFHLAAERLTLPAFGGFTGGHRVGLDAGDRVFVVGDDRVVELDARGAR